MQADDAQKLADGLVKTDPASAFRNGLALLNADYQEMLLPAARRLADRNRTDPRMAQLLGLAARAAGDGPAAYAAFARAARLAPGDALLAHSHARTALEAGKPAVTLFERARQLAPQDASIILGLTAALLAERRGSEAVERLAAIVDANPLWIDGHRSLAHLRGQLGLDPLDRIEHALGHQSKSADLHRLRIATLLEARRAPDAARAAHEAEAALGTPDWLALLRAHTVSETGELAEADRLFGAAPAPEAREEVALVARHALRAGRPEQAVALLEPRIHDDRDHLFWPYLSLAWRLLDDPRWHWLEGDPSMVGVYDIGEDVGDLDQLARHLRALHFGVEAPLDQSVRGGTQTDGNLLLRDEAPIRVLRTAIGEAVREHVTQLASAREGHPTLVSRREPQRIAGSWSVRLTDAGFHTDHVHSQGWFSSAFYVALPDSLEPDSPNPSTHAGWLSLGECRDLVPGLEPVRLVEPRAGRLVLFPSTMWHGTRPFPSGERMTVAFDVALPRQQ